MKKDLRLDKPAGHSGVQHNQWHAPTTPRPALAPGRRNGAFRYRQEPSHRRRERHCCRQDRHCRRLVRGRSSGHRHRADSPNPAVPGKQDIYLPGLQPGDPTRDRPPRDSPGVRPRQQAPLALALLGAPGTSTPDRALTAAPGLGRSERVLQDLDASAGLPPRQNARPWWSGPSPGGRAWRDDEDDDVLRM